MKMSLGRLDLENRRDVDHNLLLGRRHSHSLNKTKPNSKSVINSVSCYLGLTISWLLQRVISPALPSAVQITSAAQTSFTPLLLLFFVVSPE